LEFLAEESCGLCAPCREGTVAMVEIVGRLAQGAGRREDIDALRDLAGVMTSSSLCGLGQGAPIPVIDTLRFFNQAYENRISQSYYIRGLKGSLR
jgi:NADH:ubiquinone oxidoreductase subunit F (NADH-binding)